MKKQVEENFETLFMYLAHARYGFKLAGGAVQEDAEPHYRLKLYHHAVASASFDAKGRIIQDLPTETMWYAVESEGYDIVEGPSLAEVVKLAVKIGRDHSLIPKDSSELQDCRAFHGYDENDERW